MPKLVCMLGVIGSGKDYRSSQLVEQGYIQVNFADPLRALAWSILGWSPKSNEEYEIFKRDNIKSQLGNVGISITGRIFLQNLGSAMRNISYNFWADKWFDGVYSLLSQDKNIVCSDLRHVNELKAALDFLQEISIYDGLEHFLCEVEFIFCDYRSDRYEPDNKHISEHLAQRILKDGHKDGDILSVEYLQDLLKG